MEQTYRKHLISFIQNEHPHLVGLQDAALDHVLDTARSANDYLRAILESLHVLADIGSTNTGVALDAHEVTNGDNDLLNLLRKFTGRRQDQTLASLKARVDLLQGSHRESGSLASSGLGLSNNIGACSAEWLEYSVS